MYLSQISSGNLLLQLLQISSGNPLVYLLWISSGNLSVYTYISQITQTICLLQISSGNPLVYLLWISSGDLLVYIYHILLKQSVYCRLAKTVIIFCVQTTQLRLLPRQTHAVLGAAPQSCPNMLLYVYLDETFVFRLTIPEFSVLPKSCGVALSGADLHGQYYQR